MAVKVIGTVKTINSIDYVCLGCGWSAEIWLESSSILQEGDGCWSATWPSDGAGNQWLHCVVWLHNCEIVTQLTRTAFEQLSPQRLDEEESIQEAPLALNVPSRDVTITYKMINCGKKSDGCCTVSNFDYHENRVWLPWFDNWSAFSDVDVKVRRLGVFLLFHGCWGETSCQ